MINLKLADYGEKKDKFHKFLELGAKPNGFKYLGDSIEVENEERTKWQTYYLDTENGDINTAKDPLKRFGNLFDGRTYGNGRFVLLRGTGYEDLRKKPIFEFDYVAEVDKTIMVMPLDFWQVSDLYAKDYSLILETDYDREKWSEKYCDNWLSCPDCYEIVGNIFENPELWEKVK